MMKLRGHNISQLTFDCLQLVYLLQDLQRLGLSDDLLDGLQILRIDIELSHVDACVFDGLCDHLNAVCLRCSQLFSDDGLGLADLLSADVPSSGVDLLYLRLTLCLYLPALSVSVCLDQDLSSDSL